MFMQERSQVNLGSRTTILCHGSSYKLHKEELLQILCHGSSYKLHKEESLQTIE